MVGENGRLRWSVAAVLAGSIVAVPVGRAFACGATPTPFYEVASQAPTGDVVALNAPLVVSLSAMAGALTGDAPPLDASLSLVRVDTGEVVPVEALGGLEVLTFLPTQQLEPLATYRAGFATGQVSSLLPDPPGTALWEFTTGDSVQAPLEVLDALEVTLEAGTDPLVDCGVGCGCVETGEVYEVIKARVRLPRVVGGFAQRWAEVVLTSDQPYPFTTGMKGSVPFESAVQVSTLASFEDETLVDVLMTVPTDDFAYQPCFALRATDARGDAAYAEPVCLETLPPNASRPPGEPAQPGEPAEASRARSRSSSACSVTSASNVAGARLDAAVLLLAMLVVAARRRRR